jgi:hypothetical protein
MTIKHFMNFMESKRPADVREVELMNGCDFYDVPVVDYADATVLVDDNDDVYAIGGVQQIVEEGVILNFVWMLCTDKVEKHQIAFLRAAKDLLNRYLEKYIHLENWVWLGNEQHVKWLKWMGADFFDVRQVNGEDFQCFVFATDEAKAEAKEAREGIE